MVIKNVISRKYLQHCLLAQLVEHISDKDAVPGSSPGGTTKSNLESKNTVA